MVGSYFYELKGEFDEPLDLTDIDTLDVRDLDAVRGRIRPNQYSAVIHLGAETDVDRCEREPEHAFRTNAVGTQNVALACQSSRTVMVYTSTAGVFGGDGATGPFTEQDPPHPANVYGASKLAGERHVQALLDRFFIVRPGWMMGGNTKDKKFVAKMLAQIREGSDIRAVNDKVGSPTFARELVVGIRELLRSGRYGLYHMTNHGVCSRYDVACAIVEYMRSPIRVIPVNSAHFPLPAPRANSEAMRNLNLELVGLDHMSDWRPALVAYLEECTRQDRGRA